MNANALPLRDIKPLLQIEDFSLYVFASLVVVALIVIIALIAYLRKLFRGKDLKKFKLSISRFKRLDTRESKIFSYEAGKIIFEIKKLSVDIINDKNSDKVAKMLQKLDMFYDILEQYKYKKSYNEDLSDEVKQLHKKLCKELNDYI